MVFLSVILSVLMNSLNDLVSEFAAVLKGGMSGWILASVSPTSPWAFLDVQQMTCLVGESFPMAQRHAHLTGHLRSGSSV